MPDKLQYPAHDVHCDRNCVHFGLIVFGCKTVGEGCCAEDEWRDGGACEIGAEEEVESRVGHGSEGAEVEWEV